MAQYKKHINPRTNNKGIMTITEKEVNTVCEELFGSSDFVLLEQKERIIEKVAENVFWPNQTCEQIEDIVRDEINNNE